MKSPAYRPLLFIFAVVLAMAAIAAWRGAHQPHDPTPWRATLAQARQESKATSKPVLAYFTASWCPPCQNMKSQTWPDNSVQAALRNYIPVKIDVDEFHDIASEFGVDAIPRVQIIAPDGTPGRAHIGYFAPKDLAAWLQPS